MTGERRPRSVGDIDAMRVAAGVCRHCGGPVPCWSPFGDRAVGKRHTAKSIAAMARGGRR